MTHVHFYQLLGDQAHTNLYALNLACRLANKACRQNQKALIYCKDNTVIQELESLLWQHIPTSFLAHSQSPSDKAPLYLCSNDEPGEYHDLLINLETETPHWFGRFQNLAEIIYGNEHQTQTKRERFTFYKHRGYPLEFSKIQPESSAS